MCDRIILINRGRVLASEPLAALRTQLERTRRVRVEVDGPRDEVMNMFSRLPGVTRVEKYESQRIRDRDQEKRETALLVLEYDGVEIGREVSRTVLQRGWGLLEVRRLEPTLEDLYLKLIHESDGSRVG